MGWSDNTKAGSGIIALLSSVPVDALLSAGYMSQETLRDSGTRFLSPLLPAPCKV